MFIVIYIYYAVTQSSFVNDKPWNT